MNIRTKVVILMQEVEAEKNGMGSDERVIGAPITMILLERTSPFQQYFNYLSTIL
jgi:hypothetical protein